MSTTYMEVVNEVLGEMNEVRLTSSNFNTATNIQASVKDFVNRAYFDINNPVYQWPWLATNNSQDEFYGNTYIETVAGTRWYLLDSTASDFNDDYGWVDWAHFHLTTEGVSGESSPYTVKNLNYLEIEEWRDRYATTEEANKYNTSSYSTPLRVMRSPDGRRFGLSPIPDKVYRVYFFAYNRPVKLENYDDTINLPDQFRNVLISRTRYYAWQRKENGEQARIAYEEYKEGFKGMRQQSLNPAPDKMTDTRVRHV